MNTDKRKQDGSFLVCGLKLNGLQGALNHGVGGRWNDPHFHTLNNRLIMKVGF